MKLLLSPIQLQAAISALAVRGGTHGHFIYFYDTPALDLLSKGVIFCFREGARRLTLRQSSGHEYPGKKFVYAIRQTLQV